MDMDTQLDPQDQLDPESETALENESPEAPPPQYLWNEDLEDNLVDQLKKLVEHYGDEFKFSRRLEVMQSYKARSFWREMQHLEWDDSSNNWDIFGIPSGGGGSSSSDEGGGSGDSAVLYSTNIYQGFGNAFIAIITQSIPSLRFQPEDPDDEADVETSKACEPLRRIVQHKNNPTDLMARGAYFGYTDGRIHGRTRMEVDPRTKAPRETQDMYGVLECKVPIVYDRQARFPYFMFSDEYHLSQVREKVQGRNFEDKDYYKKIKGGKAGGGEDAYERTARISIKQGISIKSAGGDAYSHLVTCVRTWMRPSCFLEDKVEDQYRDQLKAKFPNGCMIEFDNGVYTGSQDRCMDDEWAVRNVMEGDGSFRNGKGTCMVSVQERANDIINVTQDGFEKQQPAKHYDDKMFDVDGMKRQVSTPGAIHGVNVDDLQPGDTIAAHVFEEKAASVDGTQLAYLKELMTDVPEQLTGLASVLFGADTSGDKSGKALGIQQAAAMGIVGLPFRVMKSLYAEMMDQAVRCAAKNRKEDMRMGIPAKDGSIERIEVRIEDLHGEVFCYPDSDENYPESWIQKKMTYLQLLTEAATDPAMKAILMTPKNLEMGKNLIGLPDLEIPGADSYNKQMAEINIMLTEPPNITEPPPVDVPNPITGDPESIQPPAVPQPTLPIDPIFDDHAAEFETGKDWMNSPDGQRAKRDNPDGFMNVRLHLLMHQQVLQQQQAQQMAQAALMSQHGAPPHPSQTPKPKGKDETPPAQVEEKPKSPNGPVA